MCWKKWAAKHEHEELKEGAWLEPGVALLRKKVKDNWTGKHRNVARKEDLLGRRLDAKETSMLAGRIPANVKLARRRKAQRKHSVSHCPEWYEVRREIPEAFRKWEQTARTSKKKEWKWQRGIVTCDGLSLTVLATVFRMNKFEGKGGTCFLGRNLRLRTL